MGLCLSITPGKRLKVTPISRRLREDLPWCARSWMPGLRRAVVDGQRLERGSADPPPCDRARLDAAFRFRIANHILQAVVAGSLPAIDVKNLTRHKRRAVEVEHSIHDLGHLSHPSHWMERRQRLMGLRRVHRRLDYSR